MRPLFLAALMSFAATTQAQPAGNQTGSKKPAAAREQAVEAKPQPPPEVAIKGSLEGKSPSVVEQRNQRGAKEDRERDRRDLAAQEWMAISTGAQAILTLFGLGLIGWTLYHTRRAANAAEGAVAEAGLATKAAQATAEAYVAVERARLILGPDDGFRDSGRGGLVLGIRGENIGKSTGHVQRLGGISVAHNGPPPAFVLKPVSVSIHEKQREFVGVVEVHDNDVAYPYLSGAVVYRSAIGEHTSYFCFKITNEPINPYNEGGPRAEIAHRGEGWPEDT